MRKILSTYWQKVQALRCILRANRNNTFLKLANIDYTISKKLKIYILKC